MKLTAIWDRVESIRHAIAARLFRLAIDAIAYQFNGRSMLYRRSFMREFDRYSGTCAHQLRAEMKRAMGASFTAADNRLFDAMIKASREDERVGNRGAVN